MAQTDKEFRSSMYVRIERTEKEITNLSRDLHSHLKVAEIIEGNDKEKITKLSNSMEKLTDSINNADYVKTSELAEKLKPIENSLKNKISLVQLIGVATVFSILITIILKVVLTIN